MVGANSNPIWENSHSPPTIPKDKVSGKSSLLPKKQNQPNKQTQKPQHAQGNRFQKFALSENKIKYSQYLWS